MISVSDIEKISELQYVQKSMLFLVPLLNVDEPENSYLFITANGFEPINAIVLEYKYAYYGNIVDYVFKANDKYYSVININKLNENIKNVYNNLTHKKDNIIYSKYSNIDPNTKREIIKHYTIYKNMDIVSEITRCLYPQKNLHLIAEKLYTTPKDKDILNDIEKIGEYCSAIDIEKETISVSVDTYLYIKTILKL